MEVKAARPLENSSSRPSPMVDIEIARKLLQTHNISPDSDSELEAESDADSDDETSIKSTRSFPANTIEFITENSRRYCNQSYHMPNDEAEQTRLNIIHQIYLILLNGKLTTVPVLRDAPRILDIGTGPGDWAIEMSGIYPEATIVATDISVFDAGIGHIDLPNVFFELDDARDEWTYHEPFDLVHLRGLSGAFRDWSSVYDQAFKHLRPGGYIEITDADPAGDTVTLPNCENSYLSIYASAMRSAAEAAGYPRDLGHLRSAMLNDAGFVDVQVIEREVPIGLWPEDLQEKTLGKMVLIALLEGLEAYSLRHLTATSKWTAGEVRDLCEKVKMELITAKRMTGRIRILSGRKPISAKTENHDRGTA